MISTLSSEVPLALLLLLVLVLLLVLRTALRVS